jgi:hypothetical protein
LIGRRLRADVLTAQPDEPTADVRPRVVRSPHSFALVMTAEGILLGRLRGSTLDDAGPTIPAAEVMEAGPSSRAARQRRF